MTTPSLPGRTLSTATKRAVALYRHQHQHLFAASAASAAMVSPSESLAQAQSTKAQQGQTEAGPSGFISLRTLELLAGQGGLGNMDFGEWHWTRHFWVEDAGDVDVHVL
ncbi:hypothetical protein B0T18DRAFT_391449 [Schizothecium vesticola]|uniref:Uncharacterized protein n=1 Tax=Schizothecium vesticola TaxID=314040 RepID=A0AA40EX46_9PEZI|nr:hypothetical protein B0T18DRAFT_391449 [Schizothecium vesticola]